MELDVVFTEQNETINAQMDEVISLTEEQTKQAYNKGQADKQAEMEEDIGEAYEKGQADKEVEMTGKIEEAYERGQTDKQAEMQEDINKAYQQGQTDKETEMQGEITEAYNNGKEQGKQDEYDRFWDIYQDYGNRRGYRYAFAGYGWTVDTFKPKYKMTLIGSLNAVGMFNLCNSSTEGAENALDYRKFAHLLDFSQATSAQSTFYSARINHIDVDFSNCTTLITCFSGEYTHNYLSDLRLKVSEKCTAYTNTFIYCAYLTNLTFVEGSVIAANISFNRSPKLTKASLLSIFNALSTTKTGLTVTVHRKAVDKAFETSEGANDGSTSQEWLDLIATRSNWTVSLSDLT